MITEKELEEVEKGLKAGMSLTKACGNSERLRKAYSRHYERIEREKKEALAKPFEYTEEEWAKTFPKWLEMPKIKQDCIKAAISGTLLCGKNPKYTTLAKTMLKALDPGLFSETAEKDKPKLDQYKDLLADMLKGINTDGNPDGKPRIITD